MDKTGMKYKLIRTTCTVLALTSLATGISHTATRIKYPTEVIPFTQEDRVNNLVFGKELSAILEEEVQFSNPELETIIRKEINGPITREALLEIKSLDILNTLSNTNLSDLKYLPNLHTLYIYDNTIDLNDIRYNQDLYALSLTNCTFKNTPSIPNSTTALYFDNCTCLDKETIIPYYTTSVYSQKTVLNNLRLRNPSILEDLYITSDVMLDMNNLKDCTSLKSLAIILSSNIKNAQVLRTLPSLEKVIIDEYASIWLDNETLSALPVSLEQKAIVSDLISKLDSIARTLASDTSITDEEKIKRVTLYLLEKLNYDEDAVEKRGEDQRVTNYNCYPITTSLEGNLGICINYSCMFQALTNRLGLDSYQLFNDVHAWNAINIDGEYKGYDLTYLELGPIIDINELGQMVMIRDITTEEIIKDGKSNKLYYYEFNLDSILDDNHLAEYTPEEIKDYIVNTGYINENSIVKVIYQGKAKIYKMSLFYNSLLIMGLLTSIYETLSYKRQKKLIKKDESITEE